MVFFEETWYLLFIQQAAWVLKSKIFGLKILLFRTQTASYTKSKDLLVFILVYLSKKTHCEDFRRKQNQNWRCKNQCVNFLAWLHANNRHQTLKLILSKWRETEKAKKGLICSIFLSQQRISYQCVKCNMPCSPLKICVNSAFHDGFLIPF